MPLFGVKADEGVVLLHFDPAHLISHIHPAFGLKKLGRSELGFVVRHVVEHVEKHSVRESLYGRLLHLTFWLAHIVALRDADVDLKAVIVIGVAQLRGL